MTLNETALDWICLRLRFEAPQDAKLQMLSRRAGLSGNLIYIAIIIVTFSGFGFSITHLQNIEARRQLRWAWQLMVTATPMFDVWRPRVPHSSCTCLEWPPVFCKVGVITGCRSVADLRFANGGRQGRAPQARVCAIFCSLVKQETLLLGLQNSLLQPAYNGQDRDSKRRQTQACWKVETFYKQPLTLVFPRLIVCSRLSNNINMLAKKLSGRQRGYGSRPRAGSATAAFRRLLKKHLCKRF